jgi:hypothetical protein
VKFPSLPKTAFFGLRSALGARAPIVPSWRMTLAGTALLVFSCATVDPPSPPARTTDLCPCIGADCTTLSPATRFGLYDEDFCGPYSSELDRHISLLGAVPAYASWFIQIDDTFPGAIISANSSRSINTVISINLMSLSLDSARNDSVLAEIAGGVWDSTLTVFAGRAVACGETVFLRFGYEMNGDWFSWGNKPQQFVAAWHHAHALFLAAGAHSVRWVFSPNILCAGQTFEHDILPYYPGDSEVDVIGVDGYNFGDGYDQWHSWTSFGDVVVPTLEKLKAFDKPRWVTETACPNDPRRPAWIEDMTAYLDRNPCIEAVFWFSAAKPNEPDFRIESDSASLAVLRTWLRR